MPTAHLHGNGERCPACELQRDAMARRADGEGKDPASCQTISVSCNQCCGTGWIAWSIVEMIAKAKAAIAAGETWPPPRAE